MNFNRNICDPEDYFGDVREKQWDAEWIFPAEHGIEVCMVHLLA